MGRQALRRFGLIALALGFCLFGGSALHAQNAYIANQMDNTVSVISTLTNAVIATVPVGTTPDSAAVTPDGSAVYVGYAGAVGVIATASNSFIEGIPVSSGAGALALSADGTKLYVTGGANTVSVITLASNSVTATIPVGGTPFGVAATPDGSAVYVANLSSDNVSAISVATNTVTATIPMGSGANPRQLAITPDSSKVYVANSRFDNVAVIATATNTVVATIPLVTGADPHGVAVSPDGARVYVANRDAGTVLVIATATNTVIATIPVNFGLEGIAVTPDGGAVYVANALSNTVSVISAASNTVTATIPVGRSPISLGMFIGGRLPLTVSLAGSGAGVVSSSPQGYPSGISCGATCSSRFYIGSTVTLTASASVGSTFAGWSGGGCSGTGTCTVTMSAATSVTATFTANPTAVTLGIASAGTGSGTVTSSPSGINCGATCNANFNQGTQITLTAVPNSNSTFAGWSGGGCSGTAPCTLTLNSNTVVTASFTLVQTGNLQLLASDLPESRSVMVGNVASAFATIINLGPGTATSCTVAPATTVPASFSFQTTDPATNKVTGTANTGADIAPLAAQTYVFAFTPNAAFAPTRITLTYACSNSQPAPVVVDLNTFTLVASVTPVPDTIAIVASGDPGYVDIPGPTGTGDFAVAIANVGINATIIASIDTGVANVPVTTTICQTNTQTGACLAPPTPTVTLPVPGGTTASFGVFVTGSATVPDNPKANRAIVRLTDTGGTLRGQTSVAIRTR